MACPARLSKAFATAAALTAAFWLPCRRAGRLGDCVRYLGCTKQHGHICDAPLFRAVIMAQTDMLRLLLEEGGVDPAQVRPEWLQVCTPCSP